LVIVEEAEVAILTGKEETLVALSLGSAEPEAQVRPLNKFAAGEG